MASIPPKFADGIDNQPAQSRDHQAINNLRQNLQSARDLVSYNQNSVWKSGHRKIDKLFADVKPGEIVELGIPPGLNGRLIPLQFFKQDIPASVWIYHHDKLAVFASSWISHGVDMERLFFIRSDSPVRQLRPLFLDDCFKRIVLDAPKKFSRGDLAFISRQARNFQQSIFLIRHFFITPRQGNPYASLRLNCSQKFNGDFELQVLKGRDQFKTNIAQVEIIGHDQL